MTPNDVLSTTAHPLHDICHGVVVAGNNPNRVYTASILSSVLATMQPGDATINSTDSDNVTPLHLAITSPPVVDHYGSPGEVIQRYLHDPVEVLRIMLNHGYKTANSNENVDSDSDENDENGTSNTNNDIYATIPVTKPSLTKKVDGSPPFCTAISMANFPWPHTDPNTPKTVENQIYHPTVEVLNLLIDEAIRRDSAEASAPSMQDNSDSDSIESTALYQLLMSPDTSQNTPLGLAVSTNIPGVVACVLDGLKKAFKADTVPCEVLNKKCDRVGSKPLHLVRSKEVFDLLVSNGGVDFSSLDHYDRNFLHTLSSLNIQGCALLCQVASQLDDIPGLMNQKDVRGRKPFEAAISKGFVIPTDARKLFGIASDVEGTENGSKHTKIFTHETCLKHHSCHEIRRDGEHDDPPPENVRRLEVLVGTREGGGLLRKKNGATNVEWEESSRRAAIGDVLKCHEYSYVERVAKICKGITGPESAIAQIDPDTAVSRLTFESSMRAAGAVCQAVDEVMNPNSKTANAFCAVRPPGHHAGPRGICTCRNDPNGSHGFCLLNSVAIAAAYARSNYRNFDTGKKKEEGRSGLRVCILDFDVHHGNGTEEIVRNLVPIEEKGVVNLPFVNGELRTVRYRPWLDETDVDNVLFASVHGFGPRDLSMGTQLSGWFYPASGRPGVSDKLNSDPRIRSNAVNASKMAAEDFIQSQTWINMNRCSFENDDLSGDKNCCKIINVGLPLPPLNHPQGMQRVDTRDAWRKTVFPQVDEFSPDIIFISAGFDAHKKDEMNFGYVGMIEEDYKWLTANIVKLANKHCSGRVVSVQEGGYRLFGGPISPFARSVEAHVEGLREGANSSEKYSAEEMEFESQWERETVEEKERARVAKVEKKRLMMEAMLQQQQREVAGTAPENVDAHVGGATNGFEESPRKRRRGNGGSVDYAQLDAEMRARGE